MRESTDAALSVSAAPAARASKRGRNADDAARSFHGRDQFTPAVDFWSVAEVEIEPQFLPHSGRETERKNPTGVTKKNESRGSVFEWGPGVTESNEKKGLASVSGNWQARRRKRFRVGTRCNGK